MTSITWNGKNSYDDFGAAIKTYNHGYPAKNNYIVQVPFSSAVIDFTPMQKESYSTREIKYTFNIIDPDILRLHNKVVAFTNWILEGNSFEPLFDISNRYHFMAKSLTCVPTFNHFVCELEVTFISLPYRISENYANAKWDNFCFDTDYLNPAEYICKKSGSNTFHFYNYGLHDICPEAEYIKSGSGTLTLYKTDMGKPITIDDNVKKLDGFILKPGINEFYLSGNINAGIRLIACEEVI